MSSNPRGVDSLGNPKGAGVFEGRGAVVHNGHKSDHMKISSVREFRDKATGFLRSKDPILVTRRGRLADIFFPWPQGTLPIELKREVFPVLSDQVRRQVKKQKGRFSKTSQHGGRTGVRLVADANVLLSAVLGGRARAVLEQTGEIDVSRRKPRSPRFKSTLQNWPPRNVSLDIVLIAVATLPVKVVEREVYEESIPEARRRIVRGDPDDVEILALALHTGAALWSNDNDFEDADIEWFTTAELLERLGRGRGIVLFTNGRFEFWRSGKAQDAIRRAR